MEIHVAPLVTIVEKKAQASLRLAANRPRPFRWTAIWQGATRTLTEIPIGNATCGGKMTRRATLPNGNATRDPAGTRTS